MLYLYNKRLNRKNCAYVVEHLTGVRGGEAEARPTLVEGSRWEAGNDDSYPSLQHLATHRTENNEDIQ